MVEEAGTAAPPAARRVRAVLRGREPGTALVLFNNRASPGHTTLMLPGGGVEAGETPLGALSRELAEECGVAARLTAKNARFVLARTYQFDAPGGGAGGVVDLAFFEVDLPGCVPRNMEPDRVWALDFVRLEDVRRWLAGPESNYRIQLGAMDALEAVLDPRRSAEVEGGGGREISRLSAPRDPRSRLPHHAPPADSAAAG